jgi:hypothetical protein
MAISKSARWSILLLLFLGAAIFFKLKNSAATGTFLALALIFEFCFLAGILKIHDKID